mgnify:CR=1 FL=1
MCIRDRFRNEEQTMRAKMLELDWVEAVIGLGPNLFYNSPMESCVVVCNRRKPAARKGKVLFIAKVTKDLASRGLHAGNLVKAVARETGGGGGGRPDFAQAGGRDPSRLDAALEKALALIREAVA